MFSPAAPGRSQVRCRWALRSRSKFEVAHASLMLRSGAGAFAVTPPPSISSVNPWQQGIVWRPSQVTTMRRNGSEHWNCSAFIWCHSAAFQWCVVPAGK
jgi:hypothetical protein